MRRRDPFAENEWYHCYNRGVDKRDIFLSPHDQQRFMMLMFISNDATDHALLSNLYQGPSLVEILARERGEPIVDIGAYCLMTNHFHLLLRERTEGGITRFMRKLCTGYSMYFNLLNVRTGPLFSGRFKSKHVDSETYFKRLCNYIHANPAEMREPGWKEGVIEDPEGVRTFLEGYPYSSLPDYIAPKRPEGAIIGSGVKEYYDDLKDLSVERILEEAVVFARTETTEDGPW